MSFDGCTYVDPGSGAPCLKARGHDDVKGGWRCVHCTPTGDPGRDEHYVCACGRGAQAASQHLTMVGWDGKAVTKIVPLEEFAIKQEQIDTNLHVKPFYSRSMIEGAITRHVHKPSCASRKAPPGRLLTGEFACDCKTPKCSECAKISGQKPRPGVHIHPTRPDELVCGWCARRIELDRKKGKS